MMSNVLIIVLRGWLPNISANNLAGFGMTGSTAPAALWSAVFVDGMNDALITFAWLDPRCAAVPVPSGCYHAF